MNAWTAQTQEADLRPARLKIRLLEDNIATFKARLATATDKDSVRRQIRACEQRIAAIRAMEVSA